MTVDHYHHMSWLHKSLSVSVYPIQWLAAAPVQLSHTLANNFRGRDVLLQENEHLRKELARLKQRTLKYEALLKENDRLRAFLDNSFKLGEQMLVAELVSVNLAPYEHRVLINKGSHFGVHVGQPVLSVDGIVGQVVRVSPTNAEILLITDPSHAIPVQVNRNGLRAIAVGNGRLDQLEVPNLPNNADIQTGDLLVTSGLGGVFPQGYPVATVTEVKTQAGSRFALITAKPSAALDRIREVLITWSQESARPFLPLQASPASGAEQTVPASPRPDSDEH